MRLDHFIAKNTPLSERSAKLAIARGEVQVNQCPTTDSLLKIDRFCEILWQEQLLQPQREKVYLMLNKPKGYLSACKDSNQPTVLDLIDHPEKNSLHIAGRLDKSSTGLILITNDGQWSESLTHPDSKVEKSYLVETLQAIDHSAVEAFDKGFYFEYENTWTLPAKLEIFTPTTARVTLCEGKYHQIKRMFHRLDGNRLKSLHRDRIGEFHLPSDSAPGEYLTIDL